MNKSREQPRSDSPVISIEKVSFSYGKKLVLEDVSLSIGRNDFVWIVGPNGGGKTTLVKLLNGLLKPQCGQIKILGQAPRQARKQIGYMPQQVSFDRRFPMRVIDIVLTGRLGLNGWHGRYSNTDQEAAQSALEAVGLGQSGLAHASDLSGGQQRRMFIARALACQPEILILDEPMANLDIVIEREVRELLFELNKKQTILMVSHDPALVSTSIKSVVCVNRRVAIHPTYEVDGAMMGELYEGEVRMVRHDRTKGEESS